MTPSPCTVDHAWKLACAFFATIRSRISIRTPGNSFDMPLMTHKIHMGAQLGKRDITSSVTGNPIMITAMLNIPLKSTIVKFAIPVERQPGISRWLPNPATAVVCDSSGVGETTLTWQHTSDVEIWSRASWDAEGELFTQGGPTGSLPTGKWVGDGTLFDLYDSASKELLTTVPVNAYGSGLRKQRTRHIQG